MAADFFVLRFLRRSADGKHLMRFQSDDAVFKFLWRSVDVCVCVSLIMTGQKRLLKELNHGILSYFGHIQNYL